MNKRTKQTQKEHLKLRKEKLRILGDPKALSGIRHAAERVLQILSDQNIAMLEDEAKKYEIAKHNAENVYVKFEISPATQLPDKNELSSYELAALIQISEEKKFWAMQLTTPYTICSIL